MTELEMIKRDLAADAYQKYHKGDPLSDEEIRAGIKVLGDAASLLRVLGPQFHFAWRELMFTASDLERYREARLRS